MIFQHELCRDGEPLPVIVRARVYRDGDARGSLSCEPALYCDIDAVTDMRRQPVDTTNEENDIIRELAVSIAKGNR